MNRLSPILVLVGVLAWPVLAARAVLDDVGMAGIPAVTATIAEVSDGRSRPDQKDADGFALKLQVQDVIFGQGVPKEITLSFVARGYGRAYEFDDKPVKGQKVLVYLRQDGADWQLYRQEPNAISVISDFEDERVKGLRRINQLKDKLPKMTKDDLLAVIRTGLSLPRRWALGILVRDALPGEEFGREEIRAVLVATFEDAGQSFETVRDCDVGLQHDRQFRQSAKRHEVYLRLLTDSKRREDDARDWQRWGVLGFALTRETPYAALDAQAAEKTMRAYAAIAAGENNKYGWSAALNLSLLHLRLVGLDAPDKVKLAGQIEEALLGLLKSAQDQSADGAGAGLANIAVNLAKRPELISDRLRRVLSDPKAHTDNRRAANSLESAGAELLRQGVSTRPAASQPAATTPTDH